MGFITLNVCCTLKTCFISTDNAGEVAVQLADISNNELSTAEVSKVVTKVKELVNLARINTTLATAVVNIISNVMTSSNSAQAAASEMSVLTPASKEDCYCSVPSGSCKNLL